MYLIHSLREELLSLSVREQDIDNVNEHPGWIRTWVFRDELLMSFNFFRVMKWASERRK